MLKERLTTSWRAISATGYAAVRKAQARLTGQSAVSATCQIEGIRQIYADLGLSPATGTFVEVGAYDGETFSNTSFLADQGWRGIYVEPVAERCRVARARHVFNNVAVDQVAASNADGTTEIKVMGAISTLDQSTADAYDNMPWSRKTASRGVNQTIRLERLDSILTRNGVPSDFELMIIDIEGYELPVVEALVASAWRPRVIVIELIDENPEFAEFPELQTNAAAARKLIATAGYRTHHADPVNTVFTLQPNA
jgi:FkbM family methyltransferase